MYSIMEIRPWLRTNFFIVLFRRNKLDVAIKRINQNFYERKILLTSD